MQDLEQSGHFVDRGLGMDYSCGRALCRVHRRAAAYREECVAAGLKIHFLYLINDLDRGVGGDLGIVLVGYTRLVEGFLGNRSDSLADGAARNYHDLLNVMLLKKLRSLCQCALAGDGDGLAPVQTACGNIENCLESAVICFFQTIHMYFLPSKLIITF